VTESSEGLEPMSEQKSRSRNENISWETLNSAATQSSVTQGHLEKVKLFFRFTSSLPTRVLYIIFKILFEYAKFITRILSGIRERLRS